MKDQQNYSQHLSEPIRIEIALSYLRHEFKKLFPNSEQAFFNEIDIWPENLKLRDFWNLFHGVAMGYKLKINLLPFLTAENVRWSLEEISPTDLLFGANFPFFEKIGHHPPAIKVQELLKGSLLNEVKSGVDENSEITDRFGVDPIIAHENNERKLIVTDGNRRLLKSLVYGETRISVYVGRYKAGEHIQVNTWVPTTLLMELMRKAKEAYVGDRKVFEEVIGTVKILIENSVSGRAELGNRVLVGRENFEKDVASILGLQLPEKPDI